MNTLINQLLGHFHILEDTGRGGMSIVYRAQDTLAGSEVALKVLPPYWENDAEFVRRFLEAAERTIALRHPNIVETYEAGDANGSRFIAMEYMAGGSLTGKLRRRGRLSLQEATTVISDVAGARDYVYSQGLVHRDVKPSNILFTREGRAKLSDFGIARACRPGDHDRARHAGGHARVHEPGTGPGRPHRQPHRYWWELPCRPARPRSPRARYAPSTWHRT